MSPGATLAQAGERAVYGVVLPAQATTIQRASARASRFTPAPGVGYEVSGAQEQRCTG